MTLLVEAIESNELEVELEEREAADMMLELEHSELDDKDDDKDGEADDRGVGWFNWWSSEAACCFSCCCWQPGSNLCEPMELPSLTANMLLSWEFGLGIKYLKGSRCL